MAQAIGGNQSTVPASPALGPAQRVRELLAQAKWRKAREEAKLLVKQDRARFLPLLVEANFGLAREMIAKGLLDEARQVVAYLATLIPAAQLRALALDLESRSNPTMDS
jgi:hypothetical protein